MVNETLKNPLVCDISASAVAQLQQAAVPAEGWRRIGGAAVAGSKKARSVADRALEKSRGPWATTVSALPLGRIVRPSDQVLYHCMQMRGP
ncbi:MAG: hypothetical protein Kow00114_03520 [Kiloniellaceae bacterium]